VSRISAPCCPETTYTQYLENLVAGDRRQCQAIFQEWLDAEVPLRDLYVNLVQRSLYEIGELWECGTISVAQEHLATAITESILNLAYPRLFAGVRSAKSVLVACVPNDRHQIGARIVADYFELNNWRSLFLGAALRVTDMRSAIEEFRPDAIALSATASFNRDAIVEVAAEVRALFPHVPILVGGQALGRTERERAERLPGVRALTSLAELEKWIAENSQNA
jgi:MerR family transcriptional regulator, light-induced transcriptional regulator